MPGGGLAARLQVERMSLQPPGLVRLAVVVEAWSFEKCPGVGDLGALRPLRLLVSVAERLASLPALEQHPRSERIEGAPAAVPALGVSGGRRLPAGKIGA